MDHPLSAGRGRGKSEQFTEKRASASEREDQVEVVVVILAVTGLQHFPHAEARSRPRIPSDPSSCFEEGLSSTTGR